MFAQLKYRDNILTDVLQFRGTEFYGLWNKIRAWHSSCLVVGGLFVIECQIFILTNYSKWKSENKDVNVETHKFMKGSEQIELNNNGKKLN